MVVLPVSGDFASHCLSSLSLPPRKYPHKKGGRSESASNVQFNSQLLQRLGSLEMPGFLPAASRDAWSRRGSQSLLLVAREPRPSPPRPLVSVAKDAVSVGCQDGVGVGGVAAATSPVVKPVRCHCYRRHHSHQRRCARIRAAAVNPSAPVTRALRQSVGRGRGRGGGGSGSCHEGGARGEPGDGAEVKDAGLEAGSPERGRRTGR